MIPNCKKYEKWKSLELINDWIVWANPSDNVYHNPSYRKEGNRVYLRGLVGGGLPRSSITRLPLGYRPLKSKRIPCACRFKNEPKEVIMTCDIKNDGYLFFDTQLMSAGITTTVDYLFLDTINFEID